MNYNELVIDAAREMGADYADIRIQRTKTERIYLRNLSLKETAQNEIYGYGIRVFLNGAWGFAHSNVFHKDQLYKTLKRAFAIAHESARIKHGDGLKLATERGYIDSYKTSYKEDPFSIPISDKVEMMIEVNKTMLNYDKIKQALFLLETRKDEKRFLSTLGSDLSLETLYIEPMITATAITPQDSQSRMFHEGGKATGWEWISSLDLFDKAKLVAEEAIIKVEADSLGPEERRTLILDPMHIALTMHESIGHPTELDRVLGWEADFAGISFATPEKLKNFKYGAKLVNFVADNTLEGGLATNGYDDDGVPNQKWYIIKNGLLNEYGTTRETAPLIGLDMSRGCNRATHYFDFPINRIPNLYLEPGKENLSPQELISDTNDGVYIEGRGSFSIDQHRVNFQFGGDMFWEIKNGKKIRPLKKVIYKSNNPEFWNSVDAICDQRFFKTMGITNCGKGQPGQRGRMTHGGAVTRFRKIRVGGSR